jgi:riboflavin kinase/FMN adenylyltransferase
MEVVRDWRGLAEAQRGASVAIGNFDGVHRGHAEVIAAAAEAARRLGRRLGAGGLRPPSRGAGSSPQATTFRLTTDASAPARSRAWASAALRPALRGEMAAMTDADFARRVLAEGMGVRHVAAGSTSPSARGERATASCCGATASSGASA